MNEAKNNAMSNVLWRFADKWSTQLVSTAISTVLARILVPNDFGIVVIVNTYINIFSVFCDFGFGASLIQKKEINNCDYSTALISNVLLCIFVYIFIFFAAPYFANFYSNASLTKMIRVSATSIIISAYKNIQHAYVAKNLLFKKYFFSSLFGTIFSGFFGVALALNGYGAWSLILSNIIDMAFDTLFSYFLVKWQIKLEFSIASLRSLLNFGIKVTIVEFIDKIYSKLYQLIIGKVYTTEDLAYFDKGDSLSSKVCESITYSISSVAFPTLSKVQNDHITLKNNAKTILKLNSYIVSALMFGVCAIADNLMLVVYTDKWLFAVPYLRLFCIIRVFKPLNDVNILIIKSLGKAKTYLYQQAIERLLELLIIIFTVKISPFAMAIGLALSNFIKQIIDSYPCGKYIQYYYLDQIKDVAPNIMIAFVMFLFVYLTGKLKLNCILLLILQIIEGVIIYFGMSFIAKNESFKYLIEFIKLKVKK